jgi:type IV pilus assembly protein PilW
MAHKRDRILMDKGLDMNRQRIHSAGFTLVELMIAVLVFAIAMAGVYGVYSAQMRTHYTQLQVVDMQENLRAALYLMEREIKMAGLDPTGKAGARIRTADPDQLRITMDFTGGENNGIDDDGDGVVDDGSNGIDDNGNGLIDEPDEAEWYDGDTNDPNEDVTYGLDNDGNADGINDGLPTQNNTGAACNLIRNGQILGLNIDALNFVYLDSKGNPLASPVGDTRQIRAIQITIVARSSATPSKFTVNTVDNRSYKNQQGTVILPAQNDHFMRLMVSTEVKCRNVGL